MTPTTSNDKNTATALHLSALTQYFIPFGNFIFPMIIWGAFKERSAFINANGKQAINFQLSLFLYTLLLALIAVPIFLVSLLREIEFWGTNRQHDFFYENFRPENMSVIVVVGSVAIITFIFLKAIEFFLIINAAIKASNGNDYKFPLTIPFLK